MMSNHAYEIDRLGTAEDALSKRIQKLSRNSLSEKTGADVLDISSRIDQRGKKKYPLWHFSLGNKPLSAVVHRDGGFWFAEIDELDVSSEGESPRDAIAGLDHHIRYFVGFYSNVSEDELTDYACKLKKKFLDISFEE
jgi:hypothetical protein